MEFIDFETTVDSDDEVGSEDEVSDVDSLKSFIVDEKTEFEEEDSSRTFYCNLENVTRLLDETLAEEFHDTMIACEK